MACNSYVFFFFKPKKIQLKHVSNWTLCSCFSWLLYRLVNPTLDEWVSISKSCELPKINSFAINSGQEAPAEVEPKFNPFTGAGRRLDGKPLKYGPETASSPGSKDKRTAVSNGKEQSSAKSSSPSTSRQAQGKLVFGSNPGQSAGTKKVLHVALIVNFLNKCLCFKCDTRFFLRVGSYKGD